MLTRVGMDQAHVGLLGAFRTGPSRETRLVRRYGPKFGLHQAQSASSSEDCTAWLAAALVEGADLDQAVEALRLFAELQSVRAVVSP